jgi:hypothetical protein
MKNQLLFLLILMAIAVFDPGCKDTKAKDPKPTAQKSSSSTAAIDGSWELVWESVGGKAREDGKISQFKMIHDGFFSLIMQDSAGKWSLSGAGTCSLEENIYKETFRYSSYPGYVGATDWQEYALMGDTLYFRGFTKVIFANGEDKTASFPAFEEKRVRAKR